MEYFIRKIAIVVACFILSSCVFYNSFSFLLFAIIIRFHIEFPCNQVLETSVYYYFIHFHFRHFKGAEQRSVSRNGQQYMLLISQSLLLCRESCTNCGAALPSCSIFSLRPSKHFSKLKTDFSSLSRSAKRAKLLAKFH